MCKGSCRADARLRDCRLYEDKNKTIPPSFSPENATSLYTREALHTALGAAGCLYVADGGPSRTSVPTGLWGVCLCVADGGRPMVAPTGLCVSRLCVADGGRAMVAPTGLWGVCLCVADADERCSPVTAVKRRAHPKGVTFSLSENIRQCSRSEDSLRVCGLFVCRR